MRKSNKCSYKIGIYERNKKKFLRPEEAMNEAMRLNVQPNLIKKFVAYKCTVCHFFHVGRSTEEIKKKVNLFTQEIPVIKETLEDPHVDDVIEMVILPTEPVSETIHMADRHDNFDWDTDKRIL